MSASEDKNKNKNKPVNKNPKENKSSVNNQAVDSIIQKIGYAESKGQMYDKKTGKIIQNPNGSAKGPFQIIDTTWGGIEKQLGKKLERENWEDNVLAMKHLSKVYVNRLEKAGLPVTDSNLYMLHFLGDTGGTNFLKKLKDNPNELASNYVSADAFKENINVFVDKNTGKTRTAAEVYTEMNSRLNDGKGDNTYKPEAKQSNVPVENLEQFRSQQNFGEQDYNQQTQESTRTQQPRIDPSLNQPNQLAPRKVADNSVPENNPVAAPKMGLGMSGSLDYLPKDFGLAFLSDEELQQQEEEQQLGQDVNMAKYGGNQDTDPPKKKFSYSRNNQVANETAKESTNVVKNNKAERLSVSARNKTDKEIAQERQAKIDESVKYQDVPYTKENWRDVLAKTTQSTGDKFRVSLEPNIFDDYLNPASMIGSMASNLGQAPQQARDSDSVLPYFTSVGTPLSIGALAGIGANSTGQFANNLANPLAGTGDLINSLGNKYIPNAHKLNPNAFRTSPEKFYKQVDNATYEEGLESGLIRGKQDVDMTKGEGIVNLNKAFGDDTYYNKGSLYYKNNKELPYLFEANLGEDKFIPKVNGRTRKYTTENTSVRVSNEPLPINDPNITTYKKDWLKGYKEVETPNTAQTDKRNGGEINNSALHNKIKGTFTRNNNFEQGGQMRTTNKEGLLNEFNEGGRHEENRYGGIPQGQGDNGRMNTVEEGETKIGGYVLSDTLKLNDNDIKSLFLPKEIKSGMTFAEASKVVNDYLKEDPNNKILKKTVNKHIDSLTLGNEKARLAKEKLDLAMQQEMNPEMDPNQEMQLGEEFDQNQMFLGGEASYEEMGMPGLSQGTKALTSLMAGDQEGAISGGLSAAGSVGGTLIGGPIGGAIGGAIGEGIGGLINGIGADKKRRNAENSQHIIESNKFNNDFRYGGPDGEQPFKEKTNIFNGFESLTKTPGLVGNGMSINKSDKINFNEFDYDQDDLINKYPNSTSFQDTSNTISLSNSDLKERNGYSNPELAPDKSTTNRGIDPNSKTTPNPDDANALGKNPLQYAPILGNALSYLEAKNDKPSVINSGRIDQRFNPRYADERTLQNIVGSELNNTTNALSSATNGSEGALRTNILGAGLNKSKAMSDAYMNIDNINRGQDNEADKFNYGVNVGNREAGYRDTVFNEGSKSATKDREISARNRLFESIGGVGREITYDNRLKNMTEYDSMGRYSPQIQSKILEMQKIEEEEKKKSNTGRNGGFFSSMLNHSFENNKISQAEIEFRKKYQ